MNVIQIIGVAISAYEAVARLLPTKKSWSIVHKIFQGLTILSDALDIRTSDKKNVKAMIFLCFLIPIVSCKTLKDVECISKRSVDVTFILKSGKSVTVSVPYCDTVKLSSDKMPKL